MRTELERRPSVLALAGLVVGLTAPFFLVNLLFAAAGLVLLRGTTPRLILAAGFLAGALLAPTLPKSIITRTPVDADFTVVSSPTLRPGMGSVFLADGQGMRLEVSSPGLAPVLGDEVAIQGQAKPLPQELERTYLARGVSGVVTGRETSVTVVRHAQGVFAWGAAWRDSFIDYSRRRLPPADSAVATALAFDIRAGLDPETRTDLEQSGTVHVLAASGLHILALAWMLELLTSRLPIPLLIRRTLILCLLVVYSAAAGFHPGTFRATCSAGLRDLAMVTGREFDGLSSVAAAGIAYLLWRPNMIYDSGYQLSMVLGAGIALFRARSTGVATIPRLIRGSLVTWLVSIPIVAHLFGLVSLVSIPANLLAAALLPVCLLGLLASHAASFIYASAADVLLIPATLAAHGLEAVVRGFGSFRWWGFEVPEFSGYWLTAVYGIGLLFWRPKARPVT